jgi:hypothetical protein
MPTFSQLKVVVCTPREARSQISIWSRFTPSHVCQAALSTSH